MRLKVNESKLTLAVSNSRSLRTTVPMHIVDQMDLGERDVVVWKLDKINNKWVATIEKRKNKQYLRQ